MSCSKSTSYTADCSGPAKSYKNDVVPVIKSACLNCHSNGVNGDLSDYNTVVLLSSYMRNDIINSSMPLSGSITNAQKNAIICWINSGCPNN